MTETVYLEGVALSKNTLDNAQLYPRHKECPHCFYNLFRYKMHVGKDQGEFLPTCPHCDSDLHGW